MYVLPGEGNRLHSRGAYGKHEEVANTYIPRGGRLLRTLAPLLQTGCGALLQLSWRVPQDVATLLPPTTTTVARA